MHVWEKSRRLDAGRHSHRAAAQRTSSRWTWKMRLPQLAMSYKYGLGLDVGAVE